ncbi:MAG: DUF998 domain-containing protein [Coriobacteriales bacterium]|nr:DUF998 domain-containing protein [Coriobacteriales bacterium]
MRRSLVNWLGLTGIVAFVSYAAAVALAPLAYPGYEWTVQAVSDLSAQSAPSRALWDQLSAPYAVCSVVCATCASIFVSERLPSTRGFRTGVYLFTLMCWISDVGYGLFPLSEAGTGMAGLQDVVHVYVITVAVVLLSIVSLSLIAFAGWRDPSVRVLGLCAAGALAMMFVGAIGQGLVPHEFFGVVERFSVFAAVGFNAILGLFLFHAPRYVPDSASL